MATVFQLARVKRAVPCSSGSSQWTLDVPELTKTLLEDITHPLVVVSYFSHDQEVRDTLWTVFKELYGGIQQKRQSTGILPTGVWGWFTGTEATTSRDETRSTMTVQTLHLVYGGDEELTGQWQEEDDVGRRVEDLLCSLMVLCSTYMTVVSAGLETTQSELEKLVGSLRTLHGDGKQSKSKRRRAVLDWRWMGQDLSFWDTRDTEIDGRATLESVMDSAEDEKNDDDDRPRKIRKGLLDSVCRAFDGIECSRAPLLVSGRSRRNSEVVAFGTETGAGTFRILCDYSIEDNKAEKMSQWIRMLWKSFDTVDRVDVDSDYPNLISGAILWCRLQACLDQLNIQELSRFDTKEMQTSVREMIRERALCVGSRAYHRAMNAYLDRRPIPLPWHTLAMVHQMAQSAACEEIEARYCAVGAEGGLMMGLKDFRKACLVTEGTDGLGEGEDGVGVKDSGLGAETGERGRVVPKGGLYLEYHSANATALQEHHTSTLNDLWQALLKNRLPGARASSAGGVDAGAGSAAKVSSFSVANSALSNVAPKIKDYKDLLLAVDQVRRGYLDRCIPSPEAVSVLDNLDDMQRSESVLFLQILAAVAASTTNANTTAASSMSSATTTNTQQQQQQAATKRGTPSKRYSITNHPTVALNGRELMIHPAVGDDTRIMTGNSMGGSSSRMSNGGGRSSSSQAIDQQQAPTELELQIADILQSKRRTAQEEFAFESRRSMGSRTSGGQIAKPSAISLFQGSSNSSPYPQDDGEESGGITKAQRRDDEKASVQFGWTLLLRHANSLQYAWIWDWLYRHEGSSRQNVVACDSKTYTSSKWMILPAKDLIRTRKDWKIAYGDRVWLVSYWYSTRNATMELPEYLPRARGGSCGHIVPYGEAFVICRTCPADVLCMQCFRASDHTNHSMYLQCSWGDSVCVCCDPARLKDGHSLHCSLHDTESERAYSGHAKGRPCEIAFNADEKVYTCKSCLIDEDDDRVLCARCFHSHNHLGHDVVVQLAEEGSSCSCQDGYSWREDMICSYHSPGELESEYRPRSTPVGAVSIPTAVEPDDFVPATLTVETTHRCGHVFRAGEDVYHCLDCSAHEGVVLCSRCFYGSACVNHQWRMGEFPSAENKVASGSADDVLSSVVDGLGISQVAFGASTTSLHEGYGLGIELAAPANANSLLEQSGQDEEVFSEGVVSCGCGDPELFRKAFDCNYHLPQEFRPVPHLQHCNYLFQRHESMYHCRTCHIVGSEENEDVDGIGFMTGSDVWICGRCFDQEQHRGHRVEQVENHWNEGLYCRCGDGSILRNQETEPEVPRCQDDHSRQTVLCTTEIKEGMFYYQCKSCQIDEKWVFCEPCFVKEAHEGHSYERRRVPFGASETMRCGCGENSTFRFATHCRQHERVGGTNVVLKCQHHARAGEWVALCSDCYPSEDSGMLGRYLCQRCRETSDHSGHAVEWVRLEEDMTFPCTCGSRRRSLPPTGQSVPPALCGYHTMVYKTTPSTTLFLHSSRDYRSINHEDHNEVSGHNYSDPDNDWILRRAPSFSSFDTAAAATAASQSHCEGQLLRWKDVVWLEHVDTGRYLCSMAGYKNGQGFQEVCVGEEGYDGDHEWVVEETPWVRQHILGDE